MWKEVRQTLTNAASYLTGYGLITVIYGIILPWSSWRTIVAGEFRNLVMTLSLAGLVVGGGFAATSFTGERESKTLHALLATRITESGLFLGKTVFVVAVGYATVLLTLLLQMVTVNVALVVGGKTQGGVFPFLGTPLALAYQLTVPLGLIVLASGVGVLISLRSRTTRGTFLQNLAVNVPLLGGLYWALTRYLELAWLVLATFLIVVAVACAVVFRLSIARFGRESLVLLD